MGCIICSSSAKDAQKEVLLGLVKRHQAEIDSLNEQRKGLIVGSEHEQRLYNLILGHQNSISDIELYAEDLGLWSESWLNDVMGW